MKEGRSLSMKKVILLSCLLCIFLTLQVKAESEKNVLQERMALYKKMESITFVPWFYYAAIDQYERNIRSVRRDIPKQSSGSIAIYIRPEIWSGGLNPTTNDTNPVTISLFGGVGKDGNGDGQADSTNDEDILRTFVDYLHLQHTDREHLKIKLWRYYKRAKTVELITQYAQLYEKYNTLDIRGNAFPLPLHYNYSYRSTWGDRRSFGGLRIHEGTDIFANYGTPVRATCYGIVEIKGWNRLGGWRIGIRDLYNNYYYYAHLGGFSKEIRLGQIVEPGTVIGFVGSTGYGPPGTAGKFPPHLHFGMYKDNGYTEWSFDPYPHLRLWEKQDRLKQKRKH